MEMRKAVIITAMLLVVGFVIPDAAFQRVVSIGDVGNDGGSDNDTPWVVHPESSIDSASAFLSADLSLSQGYIHPDKDEQIVAVQLKIRAPEMEGQTRRPIDLVAVLDRSGSMSGEDRIGFARRGLLEAANMISPQDRFGIVTFSNDVRIDRTLAPLEDARQLTDAVNAIQSGGSTNLSGGVGAAAKMLIDNQRTGRLKQVLLLTDGQANRGIVGEELKSFADRLGAEGVIITSLGVGADYDVNTLIRLADGTGGGYAYVTRGDRIPVAVEGELARGQNKIVDDMKIRLALAKGVRFVRAYKYVAHAVGRSVDISAPTLSANEERKILVDLAIDRDLLKSRANSRQLVSAEISYTAAGQERSAEKLRLAADIGLTRNDAIISGSENISVMTERDLLAADLFWSKSTGELAKGDFDQFSNNLRDRAAELTVRNRTYKSATIAAKIRDMLSAATSIELDRSRRNVASMETMGKNQAALSAGIY